MDKKKLFRLLCFSALSLFLLVVFSFFVDKGVRHSRDEGFQKVNEIMEWRKDPDVISFGSSVGEKGFDSKRVAELTGWYVYNSCIDGTNFEQYKALIRAYNAYSSKKSVVLFFEAYFALQKLDAISSVERYAAYMNNDLVYNGLHNIDPDLIWKARFIPLYKNTILDHTYYKAAFTGWRSLLTHKKITDSLFGFVPAYRSWEPDQDAALDARQHSATFVDSEVVKDYIQIISELQSKGKQVVIVIPPVYKRFYAEKLDYGPLERVLDSVSRMTGCKFWDFKTSQLGDGKVNFYNSTHLNYNGALTFAGELADSLKELRGR